MPLHKGKGSQADMPMYRGILLESVVARTYSKAWRKQLERGLQRVAAPMQWGGRSGLSTQAVHLQVRLWQSSAAAAAESMALLFVDVRSAFYSVVKPMVAMAPGEHPPLTAIFSKLRLPETAYEEFCENVLQARLVKSATRSDIVEQTVAAMLRRTWFFVKEGDSVYAPRTGSRPGDPVADLLFGYVYVIARLLDQIQNEIQRQDGKAIDPDWQVATQVAWVDDMVFQIKSDAPSLLQKTACAAAIVLQICTEHGLSLAMGTSKTAVLMEYRGKKSVQARQESEKQCKTHIPVISERHGAISIPIVSFYKHLGSFIVRGGGLRQEIRTRSALTIAKLKPLRKITKNPAIAVDTRRLLIRTMAMTVLNLYSGTWFNMGVNEFSAWQAAVHRLYTAIQPRESNGEVTHTNHYQAALSVNSPMAMEPLHVAKLRLLAHLLSEGDIRIQIAILDNYKTAQAQSWLTSVMRSVIWLQDQIGTEAIPSDMHQLEDLEAWSRLHDFAPRLKKLIHQAVGAHMWRVRVHCELLQAEKEQTELLLAMGWEKPTSSIEDEHADKHFCSICQQEFATPAAVAVHEAKKHQCRIAVRRVTHDCVCRVSRFCVLSFE